MALASDQVVFFLNQMQQHQKEMVEFTLEEP